MPIFSKETFKKNNIIISGGAGDIGVEVALEFAKAGANKIALLDNNIEDLDKAVAKLIDLGCDSIKIQVDLSDESSIQNSITELYSKTHDWDVLVTTAGLFIGGTLIDYKAT